MPISIILTGSVNGTTSVANQTSYWNFIGYPDKNASINGIEMPIQKAGSVTKPRIELNANSWTGTGTFTVMKNQVATSLAISAGAGSTGTFEDASATTVSLSAGDDICLRETPGSATGTVTINYTAILYTGSDDATVTTSFFAANHPSGRTYSTASTNFFVELNGYLDTPQSTESNSQYEMRVSGTFKNLSIYIPSNSRTTNTVIALRKNGVNQSLTKTIGNLASGWFEDLSNSVSVVANDLVNWIITTSTGAQNILIGRINCEFETTNSTQMVLSHSQILAAQSRNITRYMGFTGYFDALSSITNNQRFDFPATSATAEKMGIRVSANSVASASSLTLQKNGSDTSLVVSIGSTTTGWLEDTTNSVSIVKEDLLNYKLVIGTGSGSQTMTIRSLGVHLVMPATPVVASEVSTKIISDRMLTKV